jgi:3-hydroxyacyl-CoA dehydrogenase/enoyl-CoA hydratase/3-hydroxybutyryl-CoA epimerase
MSATATVERTEGTGLGLTLDERGVAWLTFDVPGEKVNVLSLSLLDHLEGLLASARALPARGLVIASGKERSFIAGADVDEIASITKSATASALAARGQAAFQSIADLPYPTCAAIDGVCLGGGMELALACSLRVASDASEVQLGLPEVRLGILPGFGGTQRLPRLIGLTAALDLILAGRTLDGRRALKAGLVDRVVPSAYVRREAAALVLAAAAGGIARAAGRRKRGLTLRLLEGTPFGRAFILSQARSKVAAETGGHYPAPPLALTSIANAFRMDLAAGLAEEARLVGELVPTAVSKNLIGIFRATQAVKKRAGAGAHPRDVRRTAVLGAGTMGGGIAWLLASNGIAVRIKDVRREALVSGMGAAASILGKAVAKRRLTPREAERTMARISPTLDLRGFRTVDLVIEAVVERLEVKQSVVAEIEGRVADACVIASNTSSLPIARIAERARHPERVAGMHFFNPVDRMPLVEVIRGDQTSDEAVATIYTLAKRLGKTPIVVADRPGFLVNRILAPYLNEALELVRGGAPIQAVDRALVRFGMPMGPLLLLDQVGIDVAAHAAATFHQAFGERVGDPALLKAMAAANRLGRKTGRGFYQHRGKRPEPDPDAETLVRQSAAAASSPLEVEIVERCLLRMIDEAGRCLAEGVVADAADLDLAMVMGTGFPPFRGGLLRYAETLGAKRVVERLEALAAANGSRFTPGPWLVEAAREGRPLAGSLLAPAQV